MVGSVHLHTPVVEEHRQGERGALALDRLKFDRRAGAEVVRGGGTAGHGLVQKQGTLLAVGSPLFPFAKEGSMVDTRCPKRSPEHARVSICFLINGCSSISRSEVCFHFRTLKNL